MSNRGLTRHCTSPANSRSQCSLRFQRLGMDRCSRRDACVDHLEALYGSGQGRGDAGCEKAAH